MTAAVTPYEVFARSVPGGDLRHVGVVFAANDTLAASYARWLYDEEAWTEMRVVARPHLLAVDSRRTRATPRSRT